MDLMAGKSSTRFLWIILAGTRIHGQYALATQRMSNCNWTSMASSWIRCIWPTNMATPPHMVGGRTFIEFWIGSEKTGNVRMKEFGKFEAAHENSSIPV